MFVASIRAVAVGLLLGACKQAAPARVEPVSDQAKVAPTQPNPDDDAPALRPVRDPFELDDEVEDPAAALEALRHNCCEEMPADELRKHTDGTQAPVNTP
jgi:hypothetical protein